MALMHILLSIHLSESNFFLAYICQYCQGNNFTMTTKFGEYIGELSTSRHILLRQLASKLEVDTSIISK